MSDEKKRDQSLDFDAVKRKEQELKEGIYGGEKRSLEHGQIPTTPESVGTNNIPNKGDDGKQ